ncbi:MAG: hypothetical protein JJE52_12170 [Acidimicrobiia bacterium]|nr:hypothetical protein [Acidimicrobiia bacterium]
MSPAAFLLIALVVGVLGSLIVVARNRTSHGPEFAMDEFRREMQALAPQPPPAPDAVQPTRIPFRPPSLTGGPGASGGASVRPTADKPTTGRIAGIAGHRDSSLPGGRFGPEPDSRPSAGSDAR